MILIGLFYTKCSLKNKPSVFYAIAGGQKKVTVIPVLTSVTALCSQVQKQLF